MSGDRFHRELLPPPLDFYAGRGMELAGKGAWRTTSCAFHGGSDSMRVNVASGGFCCMSCGEKGGDIVAYVMAENDLDFIGAAQQLGAWVDNSSGSPTTDSSKPRRMAASDALGVIDVEANLVAIAAYNVAHGVVLADKDRERLLTAANRINRIRELFA